MKINIIYASWFGNGKKVVGELAEILKGKGLEVGLCCVNVDKTDSLTSADFYIFSSPTRKFGLPSEMKNALLGFTPPFEGVKYALMTTFMDPRTIALKKMESILNEKKMIKAVEDLKIKAKGLKGPLEDSYESMLTKFANEITDCLKKDMM